MGLTVKKPAKGRGEGKSSIIVSLILFAVIIGIAFFIYFKSRDIDLKKINAGNLIESIFSPEAYSTGKAEVEIPYDVKELYAFCTYKDMIIKCSRDSVSGLNNKGEEVWTRSILVGSPMVKTNGSELLVADKGGKDIYVLNGNGVKWDKKVDNNIINADISKSGYVTIIHEARGYKGMIKVFDPLGIEIFSKHIANKFVLKADVSPSGKLMTISSLDISGSNIDPYLEFFDMLGESLACKSLKKGEVYVSVWYLKNDVTVAVSDSSLTCIDREKGEEWEKDYTRIYSSGTILGKYIVLAVDSYDSTGAAGGSREVVILNSEGKMVAACPIRDEVINIETFSDIIAVNAGRKIYFINAGGKITGEYASKSDIEEVYFLNKQEALAVTKGSIAVVKVN